MWCAPTLTTSITMSGTSSARSNKSFTIDRRPGAFLCAYPMNWHELHNGNEYVSAIRIGARVRRPFRSVPAQDSNLRTAPKQTSDLGRWQWRSPTGAASRELDPTKLWNRLEPATRFRHARDAKRRQARTTLASRLHGPDLGRCNISHNHEKRRQHLGSGLLIRRSRLRRRASAPCSPFPRSRSQFSPSRSTFCDPARGRTSAPSSPKLTNVRNVWGAMWTVKVHHPCPRLASVAMRHHRGPS